MSNEIAIEGTKMTVGAGGKLSHAVIKSVGAGLGGLEHLVGIPGTVGGAVVGNASAGGRDIGSVVSSVTVVEKDASIRTMTQQEAGFSHRKTSLLTALAILLNKVLLIFCFLTKSLFLTKKQVVFL